MGRASSHGVGSGGPIQEPGLATEGHSRLDWPGFEELETKEEATNQGQATTVQG